MMEEMQSMKRYDEIFSHFAGALSINGDYSASQINFECLRGTIDAFESQCGKFTDYGLGYIKYIAHACEVHSSSKLLQDLKC
jgi:hypothetical protein